MNLVERGFGIVAKLQYDGGPMKVFSGMVAI